MDDYLLSGSLLERDGGARKDDPRDAAKVKTLQEVIESTSKEIDAVFGQIKKKPVARANAA